MVADDAGVHESELRPSEVRLTTLDLLDPELTVWEQIDREWGALEGLGQREAWKRRIRGIPLGRPERPEDTSPTWWRSWPAPTPTT